MNDSNEKVKNHTDLKKKRPRLVKVIDGTIYEKVCKKSVKKT